MQLFLTFSFAGIICASTGGNEVDDEPLIIENVANVTENVANVTEIVANVTEKSIIKKDFEKTEIVFKKFISFLKKEYFEVEDKFDNFIDQIENSEFFPNKLVIIRKMVSDVENTYSIMKQDVLTIKDDIQSLSEVTTKDVTRIMGLCIKLIDDLILNFGALLEDWLDLLQPLVIFDTNIIMGPLKLILQLTTMLSTSATFIEIIAEILEALNDPNSNVSDILRDFLEHLGIGGDKLDNLLPPAADNVL